MGKQYLTTLKKVLFTATIVLVVSVKGNAQKKLSNFPYSSEPTFNHSGSEIASGLENGTLSLYMSVNDFVVQKTLEINEQLRAYQVRDTNGVLVRPYRASVQFIASLYRLSALVIADWKSEDQVDIFRYTGVKKEKNGKVTVLDGSFTKMPPRMPYANEGVFLFDPGILAEVKYMEKYPPISLGSNQCLNGIYIKRIFQPPVVIQKQTTAPCTDCQQKVQQQNPCTNCQQTNCQGFCDTWNGRPSRVNPVYTDQYTNPYWNFNGTPPNTNCNYGATNSWGNGMYQQQQNCRYCGQVGCGGGCRGGGINPYPYMIAGQAINGLTMLGLAYFSQPQQTIYVQNYTTATASGGTAQTWTPTNNGSGITITPGGSTAVLNGGQGNGYTGNGTSGVILNGGQGNGASGFINNNNGQGFGNGGLNGGGSSWQGTGFSIPSQWTR